VTFLAVVLAIVSSVMGCVVIILSLVVVCVCVQRCKDTAENDEDDDSEQSSDSDEVVFSQGGIEMMEMNPLAVAKLATERLEREAAAEGRERRKSSLLQSDSETESERQARRAERLAKRKKRLYKSNKAIFGTSGVGDVL
jgi:hypothetical protein